MPTLAALAEDLGLDPADVDTVAAWLRAHDDQHTLVGDALLDEVRGVLDPDGERTAHAHDPLIDPGTCAPGFDSRS